MYCELKTNRLLLRPLNISDLCSVYTYFSDEANTRYMVRLPDKSKEETLQFLSKVTDEWKKDNPICYEFAIVFNGEQIGNVSIALNEERTVGELGWIIKKKYWKKGFALEAALALKDFAINELKVLKLTAHCDCRNINSYRLMEKIGLKLESDDGMRTYPKSGETSKELIYSLVIN